MSVYKLQWPTLSVKTNLNILLASYQMSPGVENKISTKKYFRGGSKIRKVEKIIKNHLLEILNLCNGLHFQQKSPWIFFLNSYQMSPGVKNKISTKKYFRGGSKIRKVLKIIKKHLLEILNLCNGLHYQ